MAVRPSSGVREGVTMTAPLAAINPREADKHRFEAILVADDDPTQRLIVTQTLGDEFVAVGRGRVRAHFAQAA